MRLMQGNKVIIVPILVKTIYYININSSLTGWPKEKPREFTTTQSRYSLSHQNTNNYQEKKKKVLYIMQDF